MIIGALAFTTSDGRKKPNMKTKAYEYFTEAGDRHPPSLEASITLWTASADILKSDIASDRSRCKGLRGPRSRSRRKKDSPRREDQG